jgi:hypothetical protein
MNRSRPYAIGCAAILIAMAVLCPGNVFAQAVIWSHNYGGQYNDDGYSGVRTTDGGFAVLGDSYSYGAGDHDFYLVRLDSLGDTLWTQTYGGTASDYGYDVQQTADGGFILVGVTNSFGAGGQDIYLVKTNSSGLQTWARTYGGALQDVGWSVRVVSGGYIIAGSTTSYGAGTTDVYLVRTNSLGDTLWTRTYGGASGETGFAVREVPGGGYIIAGATGSFGVGYSSVYAVRTDGNGDTLWTKTYGGEKSDIAYSVEIALDGGFVFVGATSQASGGFKDVYLAKTDPDGVMEWEETYGGAYEDRGYAVRPALDGGYYIAGTTESFGRGQVDMYAIKTNPIGEVDWDTTYGGTKSDYCRCAVGNQGTLYLIGYSSSYSSGGTDLYLVKIYGDQSTPVEEYADLLLPSTLELAQNYPNPFNLSTTIQFSLERRAAVELTVYNILGQTVRSWQPGEVPAGVHTYVWDGRDPQGHEMASGIYLYRLTAVDLNSSRAETQTRKMVLLK